MAFRELPAKLGDDRHDVAAERSRSATRRQSARILGKRFHLAVYPLKLITASPLPRGFLPKVKRTKATAWLYPPEDAQLLACPDVPLARRVLYGFLVREGLRCGEALALRWSDVDTERGAVKLDTNKTDDPRAWALAPGVAAALERFGPAGAEPGDLVFNLLNAERLADAFRIDLETAKVDPAELFERSKTRLPFAYTTCWPPSSPWHWPRGAPRHGLAKARDAGRA